MRKLFSIALLALILVSCSKEETVAPCTPTTESSTMLRGAWDKGASGDDANDPAGDSGSISDDGDDLNDGEGRRKKKKN